MTSTPPAAERGFILVVTLILLMALATLGAAYSLYARSSAAEALAPEDRLKSEAVARSGVELAVMQLLAVPEKQRPGHGGFSANVGEARVIVAYRDEAARIDLNAASKEFLAGLFVSLGAPADRAAVYADRVIGWRTQPKPDQPNDEARAYESAALGYAPRQAPYESVSELSLTLGLPQALVTRALRYVTVYSGQAGIDLAEADPLALAAVPGLDRDGVAAVLNARAGGADRQALSNLIGEAKTAAVGEAGKVFRAEIAIALPRRRVTAEIVFALNPDGVDPYDILFWRDDFDAPTPQS